MSIEKMIANLVVQVEIIETSLLVKRGLTLDGCIPEKDMLAPLSSAECYAFECTINQQHKLSFDRGNLSLAFRPHGRLYFLPREEFVSHAESMTLLGHVELTENDINTYFILRRSEQQALEQKLTLICDYLSKYGFNNVCNELSTLFKHMAPLIYYIGELCISNFYNIGKSSFELEHTLEHVLQKVIQEHENSPIEFITAIYCLHLLSRSGSYTRLEELNSTHISYCSLDKYFNEKYALYRSIEKNTSEAIIYFDSLYIEDKALLLSCMRSSINTTFIFVRHINGLNLCKKENILPHQYTNALLDQIKISANELENLQRCMDSTVSAQELFSHEYFDNFLNKVPPLCEGVYFASYIEYLIDCVITEAVRSTRSDFGMTRSARDFRLFATTIIESNVETACGLGQADYFCHVVPSDKMRIEHPLKTLIMILNAISGRMRYNSWHYAPSYFKDSDIPAGRDWFYAPRMADIADYSDQHHAGHIHATVRYSIRSPLPLRIGETILPGFVDLRLMRQSGDKYSRDELVTAIAYTEVLQFIYQNIMNYVLQDSNKFIFSFGNKKWFDKAYS